MLQHALDVLRQPDDHVHDQHHAVGQGQGSNHLILGRRKLALRVGMGRSTPQPQAWKLLWPGVSCSAKSAKTTERHFQSTAGAPSRGRGTTCPAGGLGCSSRGLQLRLLEFDHTVLVNLHAKQNSIMRRNYPNTAWTFKSLQGPRAVGL